jgi:hypothetical protein
MARRILSWALVTPLAAVGILGAHAAAYRLTGTEPGSVHAYLGHAPQVLAVLATIGLVGLASQQRGFGSRSLWSFGLVAPLGFACQEHLERLAHTGELPWLLTTPAFLVGLALQIPVAILCVAVARRVPGTLANRCPVRTSASGEAWLPLSERPLSQPRPVRLVRATGRAPPFVLAS